MKEIRRRGLTRRDFLTYASAATAGGVLAACQVGSPPAAGPTGAGPATSPAAASPGRKLGGTVVVAHNAVGTLENSLNLGSPTPRYLYEIYDRLLYQDLTAEVDAPPFKPGLAESWEISPDATVYTYKLRQGVQFHDGTPFDAEAVKFNIDRLSQPSHPFFYQRGAAATAIGWGQVAEATAVDKYTLRLRLKTPYAQLNDLVARAEYSIASPENIRRRGNDGNGQFPVGTGPFKFKEHQPGTRLVLDKNPDYFAGAPIIDQLIVRTISEPAAAVAALAAGEVHLVSDLVSPDLAKSLESNPNVQIRVRKTPGTISVNLNTKSGPTADKRVRQALNWALDRETYVKDILLGYGEPEKAFFAPSAVGYNKDLKGYSYDPDKAKALLAEAGFANGFSGTYITGSQPILSNAATYIKDQLAKINVNLTVQVLESAAKTSLANRDGTGPGVIGIGHGWNTNPPFNMDRYFPSNTAPPNGINWGFYSNPQVDELIAKAGQTVNEGERIKIYQQVEEIVMMQDAAWLVLHHGGFDPMAGSSKLFWVAANEYNYTLRNAYFVE